MCQIQQHLIQLFPIFDWTKIRRFGGHHKSSYIFQFGICRRQKSLTSSQIFIPSVFEHERLVLNQITSILRYNLAALFFATAHLIVPVLIDVPGFLISLPLCKLLFSGDCMTYFGFGVHLFRSVPSGAYICF